MPTPKKPKAPSDKERLDWVLNPHHYVYQYDHGFWFAGSHAENENIRPGRKNGRLAIDAAIAAERKGKR